MSEIAARQMGVTSVIRFNKKAYEKQTFIDAGINHHDMYFLDGGCPSEVPPPHSMAGWIVAGVDCG